MAKDISRKIIDLVESSDPEKITLNKVIAQLVDATLDLKSIEIDQNIAASERAVKALTLAQKDLFYLRQRVYNVKQNMTISRRSKKIIINK